MSDAVSERARSCGGGPSSLGYLFGNVKAEAAKSSPVSKDVAAGLASDRVVREGGSPVPFMTTGYLEAQASKSSPEFRRTSLGRQDQTPTRSINDCLHHEGEPLPQMSGSFRPSSSSKGEEARVVGVASPYHITSNHSSGTKELSKEELAASRSAGGPSSLGYLFGKN